MSGISEIRAVCLLFCVWKSNWIWENSVTLPRSALLRSTYIVFQSRHFRAYIWEWPLITKRKTAAPTATLALKQPGLHRTSVHWISTQRSLESPFFFSWSEHSWGGVCLCCESVSPHAARFTDLSSVHPAALSISKEIFTSCWKCGISGILPEPWNILFPSFFKVFFASDNTKWLQKQTCLETEMKHEERGGCDGFSWTFILWQWAVFRVCWKAQDSRCLWINHDHCADRPLFPSSFSSQCDAHTHTVAKPDFVTPLGEKPSMQMCLFNSRGSQRAPPLLLIIRAEPTDI